MDESSGNFYGKRLIIDYYFKKMPADLVQKFENQYELGSDVIKKPLCTKCLTLIVTWLLLQNLWLKTKITNIAAIW